MHSVTRFHGARGRPDVGAARERQPLPGPSRLAVRKLVTTLGRHCAAQEELAKDLRDRIATLEEGRAMAQIIHFVFARSEIRQRYFEVDPLLRHPGADWYRQVNEATLSLAKRACAALFDDRVRAADCDGLIVASSSHAGFPGLSRRLQQEFGLPLGAHCYDLAALGCAAPNPALLLASQMIQQGECRNVCVVCADALGTHGQARVHLHPPTHGQVVAQCLASDGAAALVVGRAGAEGDRLSWDTLSLDTRLWPGSLDLNDFTADDQNQPFIAVGKEIRTRLEAELAPLLTAEAVADPILFHPGGAALMNLIEERHPELAATVARSRASLAEHGNIGAASLLMVLEQALATGARLGPTLRLVALGPGIVTTITRFQGVEVAG